MTNKDRHAFVATAISVFSAKIIPLVISMYLVLRMDVYSYANWMYLFQYSLVVASGLGSVLNTEYSKRYEPLNYKERFISIFIGDRDLKIALATVFILFILQHDFEWYLSALSVLLSALIIINNYLLNSLRFRQEYGTLVFFSVLRLFGFGTIFFISQITLLSLFIVMIFSLLLPVIFILSFYNIELIKYRSNVESLFLLIYGFSTSLFISFERFYLKGSGFNAVEYSSVMYVVTIAMLVSPIIEVIKQFLVPELYRKYRLDNFTLFNDKKILFFVAVMILFQLLLPYFVLMTLNELNKLPAFLSGPIDVSLFQISIGLAFYNLYHIMNPVYFINADSNKLLLFQLLGLLLFVAMINSNVNVYYSKSLVLMFVPICLFIYRYKSFINFE